MSAAGLQILCCNPGGKICQHVLQSETSTCSVKPGRTPTTYAFLFPSNKNEQYTVVQPSNVRNCLSKQSAIWDKALSTLDIELRVMMCRVIFSSSCSCGNLSQLEVSLGVIGGVSCWGVLTLTHQVLAHVDQGFTRLPNWQQGCNDCGNQSPDERQNHPEREVTYKKTNASLVCLGLPTMWQVCNKTRAA